MCRWRVDRMVNPLNARPAPTVAIVVPAFNEELTLDESMQAVLALISELEAMQLAAPGSFTIWVDDGSLDATWQKISAFAKKDAHVRGIKLSRNFGHQNALLAGLEWAHERCDATICIDADLQHDLRVIPRFLKRYQEGYDIVYGVKNDRSTDSWFKRSSAQIYYSLLRIMGVEVIHNHADFRLMSKKSLAALLRHEERNLFVRGLIPTLGFPSVSEYYDVQSRTAGESKYSLRKMLSLAWEGITSFSMVPLRLMAVIGVLTVVLSLVATVMTVQAYYQHEVVPGWSSVVIAIFFFGGVQLFCLGILGEYLGKVYLEVKQRPRFLIEESTER